MKRGKIFTNCFSIIFFIIAITSFASCSTDESNSILDERVPLETEVPFLIVIKAYSNNQEVSANSDVNKTTLFIFDQNSNFFKQITIDNKHLLQTEPIEISCPGSNKITIVACGSLSNENKEIGNLNDATVISNIQASLKQNKSAANTLPGDLFYGQVTINRATKAVATQELRIER